jgi:hypothetical protein
VRIESICAHSGVVNTPPKISREQRRHRAQWGWKALPYGVAVATGTGEIIHFDGRYRPLIRIDAAGTHVICDGAWIDFTPIHWHYSDRDLPCRNKRTRERLDALMDDIPNLRIAVELRRNHPNV